MIHRRCFLWILGSGLFFSLGCERQTKSFGLPVGNQIPTFELPTLTGFLVKVSANDGPYLLNFWATWCPPCRAEMGGLDRLHMLLAPRGLKVLGISVDDDVFLVREYVRKEKLSFPILLDRAGQDSVRTALRVSVYPTSFLVSKTGHIVEVMTGERDWDSDSLQQKLMRLVV